LVLRSSCRLHRGPDGVFPRPFGSPSSVRVWTFFPASFTSSPPPIFRQEVAIAALKRCSSSSHRSLRGFDETSLAPTFFALFFCSQPASLSDRPLGSIFPFFFFFPLACAELSAPPFSRKLVIPVARVFRPYKQWVTRVSPCLIVPPRQPTLFLIDHPSPPFSKGRPSDVRGRLLMFGYILSPLVVVLL